MKNWFGWLRRSYNQNLFKYDFKHSSYLIDFSFSVRVRRASSHAGTVSIRGLLCIYFKRCKTTIITVLCTVVWLCLGVEGLARMLRFSLKCILTFCHLMTSAVALHPRSSMWFVGICLKVFWLQFNVRTKGNFYSE